MRELKFRAWDTETESYIEIGFDFRIDGNGNIYRRAWGETVWDRTTTLIIEQFTGLKDKKRTKEYPEGQEIYEGDIVKGGYRTGYIRYRIDPVSMEFEIKALTGDAWYDSMGPKWSCEELEIIGNIHQQKLMEQNR